MRYPNRNDRNIGNPRRVLRTNASRRRLNCANSYGWVVESWESGEAYDLACEYFGEEDINRQIIQAMSADELAKCLAFIFRMNDFEEWDEYKDSKSAE